MLAFRVVMALGTTLLAGTAWPQDFRVPALRGGDEMAPISTTDGARFWVAWRTNFEFCPGSETLAMRLVQLDGAFPALDYPVAASCAARSSRGDVATNPQGRFLIVRPAGSTLVGRIFGPYGTPLTSDFAVNQGPTGYGLGFVDALATGSFVVVWTDGGSRVVGRTVDPSGGMSGGERVLATPPAGTLQWTLGVSALTTGEAMVLWGRGVPLPYNPVDVVARYFDPLLTPVSGEFLVNQRTVSDIGGADVATAGQRSLVTWAIYDMSLGRYDIAARYVDRSAGPMGSEFQVNTASPAYGYNVACTMDAGGAAIVVWEGEDVASSAGIRGQRFTGAGTYWGPEFRVNMTSFSAQVDPAITMLPSGDFLVAFASHTGGPAGYDVLAHRFFFPVSIAAAPGPGPTNAAQVGTFRPDGRAGVSFQPYAAAGFGANTGAARLDADAETEILTGPGPSAAYGPQVRAFEPDGTPIAPVSFYAYATLRYGVHATGANVDADAVAEILTTPGAGGSFGPHVRGFDFDGARVTPVPGVSFYAFSTLRYGARGSGAEVDADGFDELLVAPGPGGAFAQRVRGFDVDAGTAAAIPSIDFAVSTCRYGATVGSSDVESDGVGGYGDGYDEIVVGTGPDPLCANRVRLFDYDGSSIQPKSDVLAYVTAYGSEVAGGDADGGDAGEVVTAVGPDPAQPGRVRLWEWNPLLSSDASGVGLQPLALDDFVPWGGLPYGAKVAVGSFAP